MKSGLPFKTLVRSSEEVLTKLGRTYLKSDVGNVVELEVSGDDAFVVKIQRLEDLPHYNPLLGGLLSGGTRRVVNVGIRLGNGGGSKAQAAKFVSELMAILPNKPWKGLGFVEKYTAKSLWNRWAAGLEDR